MAFDLSFSIDFFYAEGEPHAEFTEITERPTTVWSAICSMRELDPDEWASLADEIFNCDPNHLDEMEVMDLIQETNTCSNLTVPSIQVWIDIDGFYTLDVYEERPLLYPVS